MGSPLAEAIDTACGAHAGCFDKGGEPYVEHCLRVMCEVRDLGDDAMIVGVLHDVLEDTDVVPEGLTNRQQLALDAITRRQGEPYPDYIERVKTDDLATPVKIADLYDNLSNRRMEKLTKDDRERLTRRYQRAVRTLRVG